jgi:CCR4-NOT transcription complex subunit 7/8
LPYSPHSEGHLVPSISGYDFGYLLKILTNAPLPPVESEFFNTLHLWFPHVYDIKHIMRSVRNLKGGLQEISDSMGVRTCDAGYALSLIEGRVLRLQE